MTQNAEVPAYTVASLYVGDLKPSVNEQTLWNVFHTYGQILSVKVCRDSSTFASLGYGYVNFRTVEEADKAMSKLNFTPIDGKPCRIMWSMRDSQKRRNNQGNVFIKNLPPTIDAKALHDAFSIFGPILSLKLAMDENGSSKGFAFIQFYSEDDAGSAVRKANGVEFLNKKIVVTKFIPKSQRYEAVSSKAQKFTNVFCKNFGSEWISDDLIANFSKFGKITSCVVMNDSSGSSKGFGFINFEKFEDAEKAVEEMNGFKTDSGKEIYVARAQKKVDRIAILRQEFIKRRAENFKRYHNLNLYIKPLEEGMTDEKLKEEFSKFGTILSAKVMRDENGKSRGFGFVCFSQAEEASKAMTEMNNKIIETRPLVVVLAQSREERRNYTENRAAGMGVRPGPPFGSFPFVYAPPMGQNYMPQMAARFGPMQGVPRPLPRHIQNIHPSMVNQIRQQGGFGMQQYPFSFVPRHRSHANSHQNPQQSKQIIPGPQNRMYNSQMPGFQQAYANQFYAMGPMGVRSVVPQAVQASVNYISGSSDQTNKEQSPEASGLVPRQQDLAQADTRVPDSQRQHDATNSYSKLGDKIFEHIKDMYPTDDKVFHIQLTSTVLDSVRSDSNIAGNDIALRDLISKAHAFLTKQLQTPQAIVAAQTGSAAT